MIPPVEKTASAGSGVAVSLSELLALRGEAKRLDLSTRGKVLATRTGGHLSRFRGRGMEFYESRIYQPGDEVRNMDWRLTARAGKPHVKQFQEERERPLWLLVDQGPSMRFGTRVAFKSVIAARAAALLAWAAADRGDRVGGLVFDEAWQFEQRPAARTRGLLPLLQALARLPQHRPVGFEGLVPAAQTLVHLVRPGSLIFLLSDFLGIQQESSRWIAALGRANELVFLHFYDPLEAWAPPPGRYPVTDGRQTSLLDTRDPGQRQRWHQRFRAHVDDLETLARRYQVHLLQLRTDQPVGQALIQGLRPRALRRAG